MFSKRDLKTGLRQKFDAVNEWAKPGHAGEAETPAVFVPVGIGVNIWVWGVCVEYWGCEYVPVVNIGSVCGESQGLEGVGGSQGGSVLARAEEGLARGGNSLDTGTHNYPALRTLW